MRSFGIATACSLVVVGSVLSATACSVESKVPDLKLDFDGGSWWDASGPGSSGGNPGGDVDAGGTTPTSDAGAKDSGNGLHPKDAGPSGPTCAPQSVTGFNAHWHAPKAKQSACSTTQLGDYYTACLAPSATQTTCQQFQSANATCAGCLAPSQPTDATYGPILDQGGFVELNIAGCAALATGDQSATGCGQKLQANSQCASQSCDPVCPVTDDASLTARQSCQDATQTGVCQGYATAADAACQNVTACTGSTFQDLFNSVAATMCGM